MRELIYSQILQKRNKKQKSFAVLIDPDYLKLTNLEATINIALKHNVDYFFIGGSLIIQDRLEECLKIIRERCNIPTILFPGNGFQLSHHADALMFLSLISGRNPEYLIGKHVEVAPKLQLSSLEIIPTGYMLIDGYSSNTASYISQTFPIPSDKPEIAVATALAGQFLGFKLIFMDAGSGAKVSVSNEMVSRVSQMIQVPLIIGGGIKSGEKARELFTAGADIIVVGNAIEKDPSLIAEISNITRQNFFAESNQV